MSNELEAMFSETDEVEETSEAETETVDEQVDGEAEEATEAESTVENDAATTVAEQNEAEEESEAPETEQKVPLAAQMAERKKRQEAEAERDALRQQLEALQNGQQQEPPDPEEYIQRGEVAETVANALFQDRLMRHYDEVKSKHDDFPEKEAHFAEMAKHDQVLREKFRRATNPAEFAYIEASNDILLRKYGGNIQAMLEAVKKEQNIGDAKPVEEKKPAPRPKVPSLANETESEKTTAPVAAQTQLSEMFADSPF